MKDNTYGVRLISGSVYIASVNRLMHEGEWTCNVKNSLGSEKMILQLIVTGKIDEVCLMLGVSQLVDSRYG